MTSPRDDLPSLSDPSPPGDPHAAHPGEVFHAAGHAGPPPPVGPDHQANGPETNDPAPGVSRAAFVALLVYASAVTAVCLGLLYHLFAGGASPLESLPDVVPPRKPDGEVARLLVPADAPVPPGHTLKIGESRRFGDLLVTPLRVTREPLEFMHYRGEGARPSPGEVLKLWLRLENVSAAGRRFAPLDPALLFYRTPGHPPRANNYLAPRADRDPSKLVFVYDQPPASDWDLAGQRLGTVLAPGESVETYVPTTVDPTTVDPPAAGPLAWRVHLRKGVANNGWGVTTLVEIAFDAADVRDS